MNSVCKTFGRNSLIWGAGLVLASGLAIACRPVPDATPSDPVAGGTQPETDAPAPGSGSATPPEPTPSVPRIDPTPQPDPPKVDPPRTEAPRAEVPRTEGPRTDGPPSPTRPPISVAGDVIVKFRDASEAGQVITPIVNGKSSIESAAPLTSGLSKEIGSPLSAVRVTSGRELLLTIDREQLTQILRQRAKGAPAVRSIVAAASSARVQQPLEFVLDVKPGSDVQALVAEVVGDLGPQAHTRVEKDGKVLLTIDMAALTQRTVEQLQQRSDVEYAQANMLLKPYVQSQSN